MSEAIRVEGLAQFNRALKKMDSDLPKALRLALNEAADSVVRKARANVPRKTGKAEASIRAKSTRTASRVAEGGKRAPYMPWLDYGGRVGPNRSVKRPFIKQGRYVYPAYYAVRDSGELVGILTKALRDVAESAGLEVS